MYATSGLTRGGCLSAESRISGCYRLALARTTTPLGPNAFGRQLLAPDRLPTNTLEYTRFVTDPKSGLSLLGQFMPPKVGMKDNRLLPSGLQLIPLRPELPQWQSAPPPPAPVRR